MTTLQERLAILFPAPRRRGLQAEIQRLCDVKGSTVSAWFNQPEKVSTMERVYAEAICAQYSPHTSPAWLAEGLLPQEVSAVTHDGKTIQPAPKAGVAPPPPPAGFKDNHTLTAEQWELWQAFSILTNSAEKKNLLDRYHALKEISKAEWERAQKSGRFKEKP